MRLSFMPLLPQLPPFWQQQSKRMTQRILLHPPLSFAHPQFAAAKSLMLLASNILFTVHSMRMTCPGYLMIEKVFSFSIL